MKLGYVIFYVEDVLTTIDFYEKSFGLKRSFVHESHQYGELDTGTTKLAFASFEMGESNKIGFRKFEKSRPPTFEIALVSENVQAAFEKAIRVGAKKVKDPMVKPWGQTVGYVNDLNGFLIELCSPMN